MSAEIGTTELAEAIFAVECEGEEQQDACPRIGFTPETYRRHKREQTECWKEAERLATLAAEDLSLPAKRRALRVLNSGQDGAAVQLIIRLLGLSDKQEQSVTLKDARQAKVTEESLLGAMEVQAELERERNRESGEEDTAAIQPARPVAAPDVVSDTPGA